MRKYILLAVFLGLTIAGIANSSSIKVWGTETLLASDLNANFAHIHNTMVGGHGARLVNADVSASAAIAHTKLATPGLVAKSLGYMSSSCTSPGSCTVAQSVGAAFTITRTATAGLYQITWSVARTDNKYFPIANSTAGLTTFCQADSLGTASFQVRCEDTTGAAADATFNFIVFDNDN